MWDQHYNPLNNAALSTIAAAVPVVTLLVLIASGKVKAHLAALIALDRRQHHHDRHLHHAGRHVDPRLAARRRGRLLPDRLDRAQRHLPLPAHGRERRVRRCCSAAIGGVTADRRLQLLLIAFCFGAFFEGAAGFGTPVAVTGAMLIGLGFSPLAASGLSLIANTAPVAYRRARHADPWPRRA